MCFFFSYNTAFWSLVVLYYSAHKIPQNSNIFYLMGVFLVKGSPNTKILGRKLHFLSFSFEYFSSVMFLFIPLGNNSEISSINKIHEEGGCKQNKTKQILFKKVCLHQYILVCVSLCMLPISVGTAGPNRLKIVVVTPGGTQIRVLAAVKNQNC